MVLHGLLMPEKALPLLVEPEEPEQGSLTGLLSWLENEQVWLKERLNTHGAVLLRGFAVSDDGDFERVSRALTPELKRYVEGNSPREHTSEFVYTSTSYPAEYDISMHNELSYVDSPPRRLFFYCLIPAQTGGETPIVDCRRVLELLDPELVRRFEEHGIKYVQNVHGGVGLGRSWQQTFETEDRDEVDRYLAGNGVTAHWAEDGSLRTEQVRPAVRVHEDTGERTWFNQADQWHPTNLDEETRQGLESLLPEDKYPLNAYLGNGEPIEPADLEQIRTTLWNHAARFRWQVGDVLIVDNYLAAHGRCAFTGERAIRVAMG